MHSNNKLSPQDAIKLAGKAERLSYLKSMPGNWLGFFTSLQIGIVYCFLTYEYIPGVVMSIAIFFLVVFFQKYKTGMWPFGSAPLTLHAESVGVDKGFWKTMKLSIAAQMFAALVVMLMFASFVKVIELRIAGYWWAPIFSGAVVGLMMFIIFVNSNNYHRKKYSGSADG